MYSTLTVQWTTKEEAPWCSLLLIWFPPTELNHQIPSTEPIVVPEEADWWNSQRQESGDVKWDTDNEREGHSEGGLMLVMSELVRTKLCTQHCFQSVCWWRGLCAIETICAEYGDEVEEKLIIRVRFKDLPRASHPFWATAATATHKGGNWPQQAST
jgi:hypothetical protein